MSPLFNRTRRFGRVALSIQGRQNNKHSVIFVSFVVFFCSTDCWGLMRPLAFESIRCITFDTVGTLIYAHPSVARVYADAAAQFGSQKSEQQIADDFKRSLEAAEAACRRAGLRTSEAFERQWWRGIVAYVLDDVDDLDGCFEALFEYFSRPEVWRCYDDVPPCLAALRETGFRLVLASNFDARLHRLRAGIDALRVFSQVVLSTEVGYRKPHRAFFDAVVRATGLPRATILHVGDSWINDHQGAENAGLKSLWLCRAGSQHGEQCISNLGTLTEWLVGSRTTSPGE